MRFTSLILASTALLFSGCSSESASNASDKTAEVADKAAHTAESHGSDKKAAKTNVSEALCEGFGPQTPRDISSLVGTNSVTFKEAPNHRRLNLCNIHTHTNAEHKGPGFNVFVNDSDHGGYACNNTGSLTAEQLVDPAGGNGAYKGVKPGDTIEVHWVHTSCDITPGEGLGSCLSDTCTDPLLRVETQVFLVANDPENALDFTDFDYAGGPNAKGRHQAKALPRRTGRPVVFAGSTTGPKYTQSVCSPLNVTWSVRPQCAMVDIGSLNRWAEQGNVFNESHSHGVRQLVTAPELLSPIKAKVKQ